jgi:hypothetical protein
VAKGRTKCLRKPDNPTLAKERRSERLHLEVCPPFCIQMVLPLPEARKAQELSKTGHSGGRIVLEV